MGHIERLLLDLGRIVRRPADVELGFAAGLLLERDSDLGFARPGRHDRMARDLAGLVGERVDEHDPFQGDDLLIDEFAPHLVTLARAHPHVEEATGAKVHVHGDHGEGYGRPPFLHLLGFGQRCPDAVAGGIEHPENGKIHTSGTRHFGPHNCRLSELVCHKHHPADTEFIGDHAEFRREEGLGERHGY